MRQLFSFLLLVLCAACSCGTSGKHRLVRVGVDPTWSPLNLGPLQPYVNGYTDDFLIEVARYSGVKFEKIIANSDNLLDGLRTGEYEAVLSPLPRYTFNEAKYDFSEDFLELGPVLITPKSSSVHSLEEVPQDNLVGVIEGDPAVLLIQKFPSLIVRYYNSIPDLLNAVSSGEITSALLERLKATAYVKDLYQTSLQVASAPLTKEGLHLVQLKGSNTSFFRQFEKSLKNCQEKKKSEALQKKWQLAL